MLPEVPIFITRGGLRLHGEVNGRFYDTNGDLLASKEPINEINMLISAEKACRE